MKKRFFIVAAVIISSQLQAQQITPVLRQDTTGRILDEVILSANKYPKKQSETGKVVTVINRQQLEKNSGKSLGEILNTVSGTIILGANNNLGTNQTVSIRGSSQGNVLVLLDGIPLNDPSVNTNYFDLSLLVIDDVERIEILKGGQSTLYGSDAVAGVINIISRKPADKKIRINGSLAGGSYSTFKQHIGLSGRSKAMSYSTSYTHLSSKGFSSAYDRTGTGSFDKDGFDQHTATARLGFAISKNLQAQLFSSYTFYKTDLDAASYTDEKDYTVKNDNLQGGAGLSYSHSRGSLHFNYHFNYVERDYYDDSVSKSSPFLDWSRSRYIGRTHYAELYNNWIWPAWELLTGIDFRYNNTDQFYRAQFPPFGPGSPFIYETSLRNKNMSQSSPYASVIYKNLGFTAEIGGRLNIHSEYGTNFTFTINPSYLINDKAKLFVNLYSSFKAPTLYQLFDPSGGNADLEPEKGIIAEAGAELFSKKSFRIRAVGFYRNTKDAIQYIITDPVFFTSQYRNVSKQENYGAELEANVTLNNWGIAANYTYTDGKTRSGFDGTGGPLGKDTTYYNLYRIPKNAFNLKLGWQATNALFISTQIRALGKRAEFIYGAAPETAKGYATIDLYGEYKFGKKIKTFIDLKNITNRRYFDIPGYNSRRFNFMAGINLNL